MSQFFASGGQSFSFNISLSNEYSGLISFRTDWFDLLAVQGILKSLLQHHSSKASILWGSSRGDRDLGVAFQTHPGRQAFISSGSKEPRSALESRRVSLGAHWVDSRESSLLRRLERGREIGL